MSLKARKYALGTRRREHGTLATEATGTLTPMNRTALIWLAFASLVVAAGLVVVLQYFPKLTDSFGAVGEVLGGAFGAVAAFAALSAARASRTSAEQSREAVETVTERLGGRRHTSIRDLLGGKVDENPLHAVLTGYELVERFFNRVLKANGIPFRERDDRLGVDAMARKAVTAELIPDSSLRDVEGLTLLWELAKVGNGKDLTADKAREFLLLSDGIVYAIESELAKRGKPNGGDDPDESLWPLYY